MASLFAFATLYIVQPVLPVFTEVFQISISYASLAMSFTTVGLILGLIFIGFLSDRQGRKKFVVISIFITTFILFLLAMTPYFWFIILLRFIQGFTLAGVLAVSMAYLAEEIDQRNFGFAATIYISFNSFGGMMGRFVASYLVDTFSWEMSFMIIGIFGVFTSIFSWTILPSSKRFHRSTEKFVADLKAFTHHLKQPFLLLMFGLGAVLQISFTGMWTFLPFYLIAEPYYLSMQQIAYFYFAYSLGVIGAPIGGWLTNKYQLSTVRIAGVIILSIGMLFLLYPSLTIIIIGLSVVSLGFFVSHAIATASVSQAATDFKGSASSLYLVSYYVGVSLGSTALAPIWNTFHWQGIIIFTAILPSAYVMLVKLVQYKIKNG